MATLVKGILLDVRKEKVHVIEIKEAADELCRILNCTLLDITFRKIGNVPVNIIADDIGALQESPKISAIDSLGHAQLVGNIFIAGDTDYEKSSGLTSLSQKEIDYILSKILVLPTWKYPKGYPILTHCNF